MIALKIATADAAANGATLDAPFATKDFMKSILSLINSGIFIQKEGHLTPLESIGLEGRLIPHLPFRQQRCCGRMQQCYLLRFQMCLHLCLCPVNNYDLFALSKPWHPREWR